MNKRIIYLLTISLLLSACGSNGVNGDYDHSSDWNKNYYGEWSDGMKKIARNDVYLTDSSAIFKSFGDEEFKKAFPDAEKYSLYSEDEATGFGMHFKTTNYHQSFGNGYLSKLHDGRMICLGRYEKVRVQVGQQGFGTMLPVKGNEGDYFSIYYKSALDFKSKDSSPSTHTSVYNLKITLYKENFATTYVYKMTDYSTNADIYHIFGFKIDGGLNGVCGYSIEYDLISDEFNDVTGKRLSHALFVYEIFMPNSTWLDR